MNRNSIIDSLVCAINESGEIFQSASKKASKVSERHAEGLLNHYLSLPVTEKLRQEDEFKNGFFLRQNNGWMAFRAEQVALVLVSKARKSGSAENAIAWLEKVLATKQAYACEVMALWGISFDQCVELAESLDLVPIDKIPQSRLKQWLMELPDPMIASGGILQNPGLGVPKVALVYRTSVEPILYDLRNGPPLPEEGPLSRNSLLNDIRNALTVVGPCVPLQAISWSQFIDQDLQDAVVYGSRSYHQLEVAPMTLKLYGNFDPDIAKSVIQAYLKLNGNIRKKISIALDRLNQAMRRLHPGDQALDLSIALETLLTDGHTEHTFKLGLRAALLASQELPERQRVRSIINATYKMRSTLVHEGEVADNFKVQGQGKLPSVEIIQGAILICAALIRKLLELAEFPDWNVLELSGKPAALNVGNQVDS